MEGEEKFVRSLVNKMLRVQISDGRVLVGALLCTDRDQNLIMGGAAEYWQDETGDLFSAFLKSISDALRLIIGN